MRPDPWKPYPAVPEEAMKTNNAAYRSAVGVALAATCILVWMVPGVDVIAAAGDLADLMYIGVLAVGIIGAMLARLQPHGNGTRVVRDGAHSGVGRRDRA
jgi:hypothetical protein